MMKKLLKKRMLTSQQNPDRMDIKMKVHMNIRDPKCKLGELSVGDGFVTLPDFAPCVVTNFNTFDGNLGMTDHMVSVFSFSECKNILLDGDNTVQRVNVDIHVTEYVRRERRQNDR